MEGSGCITLIEGWITGMHAPCITVNNRERRTWARSDVRLVCIIVGACTQSALNLMGLFGKASGLSVDEVQAV